MKIHIFKPEKLLLAIFVFAIFAGFCLAGIGKAKAENYGTCISDAVSTGGGDMLPGVNVAGVTKSKCDEICTKETSNNPEGVINCRWESSSETENRLKGNSTPNTGIPDTECSGLTRFFAHPVNCTLIPVLKLMAMLLSVAATIFTWIVDTKQLDAVINNSIIYTIWALVRDVLNLAFIFVLLFSAFSTVFQVEKFSYRKILLTLIIMALLVNFSFPIARFIIDTSNVMMYYFLNSLPTALSTSSVSASDITTSNIFGVIAGQTDLNNIVYPSPTADTSMLIAAIIFTFILAVTLIVVALLLVIRTVALGIIIIFSPVAFVGSVIPVFESEAKQWWNYLFKYSFFGPVMIFMLYVAAVMMKAINKAGLQSGTLTQIANSQSADAGLVASMAFYAIPLVILWMGIGVAQKMSIAGAKEITGKANKFMGWAGKWAGYKGAWKGIKVGTRATGIPGGIKQRYEDIKEGFKSRREARESKWAARLGVSGAEDKDMNRRAKEYKDKHYQEDQLKQLCSQGDAAACKLLNDDKKMDDNTYNNFMTSKASARMKDSVTKQTKKFRIDIFANYQGKIEAGKAVSEELEKNPALTSAEQDNIRALAKHKVWYQELGKLGAEDFANQNWKDIVENNKNMHDTISGTFISLTAEARGETRKRLSAEKTNALHRTGAPV